MAYIEVDVDIEEHLDEVDTEALISEIANRYQKAKRKKDQAELALITTELKKEFGIQASNIQSSSIDELSKRELIEEFIGKISYDKLSQLLNSVS